MNGIFVAVRRLAYGDQYGPVKVKCPSCGDESDNIIDLSSVEPRPFDFQSYPKGQNLFNFTLPYSKKLVSYKILTQGEDNMIDSEVKNMAKVNKERSVETTTRLKYIIQSINGEDDKAVIRKFIENEMVSRDTLALRSHIRENIPDLKMSFPYSCKNCEFSGDVDIPMTIQFFWPSS
jgi:predicted RNA-binding Zn-ribbon protein involved in translation (DUF1610 family)